MTEDEFGPWRELTIAQHSEQVSRATGKAFDVTVAESRELLPKILPDGQATEHMHFFVVLDDSERVIGWLWLGASPADPDAGFVFDIIIDADVRGQGYGRAVMVAAEEFFRAQDKLRVGLDVLGGNDVARALYESLGYRPIQTAMTKTLGAERD